MGPEEQKLFATHMRGAAAAVEMALKLLNTTKKTCEGCGLERALNWAEMKSADELSAIARKLKKLATRTK
jgi:hypothetical protein